MRQDIQIEHTGIDNVEGATGEGEEGRGQLPKDSHSPRLTAHSIHEQQQWTVHYKWDETKQVVCRLFLDVATSPNIFSEYLEP